MYNTKMKLTLFHEGPQKMSSNGARSVKIEPLKDRISYICISTYVHLLLYIYSYIYIYITLVDILRRTHTICMHRVYILVHIPFKFVALSTRMHSSSGPSSV